MSHAAQAIKLEGFKADLEKYYTQLLNEIRSGATTAETVITAAAGAGSDGATRAPIATKANLFTATAALRGIFSPERPHSAKFDMKSEILKLLDSQIVKKAITDKEFNVLFRTALALAPAKHALKIPARLTIASPFATASPSTLLLVGPSKTGMVAAAPLPTATPHSMTATVTTTSSSAPTMLSPASKLVLSPPPVIVPSGPLMPAAAVATPERVIVPEINFFIARLKHLQEAAETDPPAAIEALNNPEADKALLSFLSIMDTYIKKMFNDFNALLKDIDAYISSLNKALLAGVDERSRVDQVAIDDFHRTVTAVLESDTGLPLTEHYRNYQQGIKRNLSAYINGTIADDDLDRNLKALFTEFKKAINDFGKGHLDEAKKAQIKKLQDSLVLYFNKSFQNFMRYMSTQLDDRYAQISKLNEVSTEIRQDLSDMSDNHAQQSGFINRVMDNINGDYNSEIKTMNAQRDLIFIDEELAALADYQVLEKEVLNKLKLFVRDFLPFDFFTVPDGLAGPPVEWGRGDATHPFLSPRATDANAAARGFVDVPLSPPAVAATFMTCAEAGIDPSQAANNGSDAAR